MLIHHLNCVSSCPLGGKWMDAGPEGVIERAHVTNHCLLIEDSDQLILVDTGFGLNDVRDPHSRLSEFFLTLNAPDFREELTAYQQIKNLGFDPKDVRHIVLTHLDFDHAGGLDDFPQARVHLLQAEKDYAFLQKTWLDRQRFRPQQWNTKKNWITYEPGEGDTWFGMNKVHSLEGISSDIAMVPLIGHTFGHSGVAVRRDDRWLLLAGDAYFYHEEMNINDPRCTPGFRFYQRMMDKDHKARVWNQRRLRELRKTYSSEIEIFCSHDVVEFERLSGHSANVTPQAVYGRRQGAESPTIRL